METSAVLPISTCAVMVPLPRAPLNRAVPPTTY